MSAFPVALSTFAAFAAVSVAMSAIPGPDVFFLVSQTLRNGRKAGLTSVGAVALGSAVNACAASVGLATVLAASTTAFTLLKLSGAAYLVFLGIKALRAEQKAAPSKSPQRTSIAALLRDGFLVSALNPKTALLFVALLPQFIKPDAPALGQSLVLGGLFIGVAACTDSIYVLVASYMAAKLRSRRFGYGRYLSAASFIGLGVYAAFET